MTFEDILKEVTGARLLFKNMEVFTEKYIPPRLPGREKQIRELVKLMRPAFRGYAPPNIIIYGKYGSGKSVVTRYALKNLKDYFAKRGDTKVPFRYAYVTCKTYRSEGKVLEKIMSDLLGRDVTLRGWSIGRFYDELTRILSIASGVTTIVLDEIDSLRDPNTILYNLSRLNVPEAEMSIIGITNNLKFLESLSGDVLSSLGAEKLVFPSYTVDELVKILRERAELGLVEGALGEGVIELCAAIAAQQEGDARKAIQLLRKSVQLAEDEGSERVEVAHVRKAVVALEKDIIEETVRGFPLQVKLVLLAIAACQKAKVENIRSGDVNVAYRLLCQELGVSPVSFRRVSSIVLELETLGLIRTDIVSFGRGLGRSRVILLDGNPNNYIKALDDIVAGLEKDFEYYVSIVRKVLLE